MPTSDPLPPVEPLATEHREPAATTSDQDVAEGRMLVEVLAGMDWRRGSSLDKLPLGLALLGADGRVERANRAVHELLGAPPGSLLGRTRDQIPGIGPSESDESLGEERALRGADGQTRLVRVSTLALSVAGSTDAGALISIRDVTAERRHLIERQTGQRLEAMGHLASGVAHEINTPIQFVGDNVTFLSEAIESLLHIIDVLVDDLRDVSRNVPRAERVARVEALLEEAGLDYYREESPLAASQARDGVNRVATIVRAMKTLGHPDRQEMTPTDLNQVLRDTVTVTHGSIKHDATVELDLQELPAIPCRPGALSQVFTNLIVNAADAIRSHRPEALGTIRVASAVAGDAIVVTVSDDGGGISPEDRERIFEPFFTTKDVGKGTGQGLAMARSVVCDQHGGSLTFDSDVGAGTTFTISLPVDWAARPPQDRG